MNVPLVLKSVTEVCCRVVVSKLHVCTMTELADEWRPSKCKTDT